MKVARTVLRGGKTERSYLSQQKVAGSNPATLTLNFLLTSPKKKWENYRDPSPYVSFIMQKEKKGVFKKSSYFLKKK